MIGACLLVVLQAIGCGRHQDVPTGGCRSGDDAGPTGPALGILQFQVTHNLTDDRCLDDGSCSLSMEVSNDHLEPWLDELQDNSNMPVVHWDGPIPWLVFDEDCSNSQDPVTFYEARLTKNWVDRLDAFARYFARALGGYLAVSLLNGTRNGIQALDNLDGEKALPVAGTCPDLSPGRTMVVQVPGTNGPQEHIFEIYRAYRNFLRYLTEKLHPRYVGLLVEANLYAQLCPGQWGSLVQFYRSLYDEIRADVGPDVALFATLTYKELLGYEPENCMTLDVQSCMGPTDPVQYSTPDPLLCFPLNLGPMHDLDEGRRLDFLALSFYPDALLMRTPQAQTWVEVYPADWDGQSDCLYRIPTVPFLNPFQALDRIGWDRPVVLSEYGARSCPVTMVHENGTDTSILLLPGSETTQHSWLLLALDEARRRHFPFFVAPFLRDYPPLGLWVYQQGVMPALLLSLFNNFACMGLSQADGDPKDAIAELWREYLLSVADPDNAPLAP